MVQNLKWDLRALPWHLPHLSAILVLGILVEVLFPPKGRVDVSLVWYPFPHFKSFPSIPFSLTSPPWQSCMSEQSNSTANWCNALNPAQTHMRAQTNITLEISLGRDIFVILVGLFLRNEKNRTTGLTFFVVTPLSRAWRLLKALVLPLSPLFQFLAHKLGLKPKTQWTPICSACLGRCWVTYF